MAVKRKTEVEQSGPKVGTPEHFVEIWQTSESAKEAASRLGMPVAIASARASIYRTMGIPLKSMRKKKTIDVDSLNELIKELNRRQGKTTEPLPNGTTERKKKPLKPEAGIKDIVRNVLSAIHASGGK